MRTTQGWMAGGSMAAVLAAGWLAWGQAQKGVSLSAPAAATVDAVIAAARVEAGLEPILERAIPEFSLLGSSPPGSYWMLQTDTPPLPWNPFPELNVFAVGGGHFLVDDRSVDYPALTAQLRAEAAVLRELERALGSAAGDAGGVFQPDGAEDGDPDDPPVYGYGPNDLWLEIISLTNATAQLRIHSPETNGVFDLFSTTNLSPYVAGLNLTNWMWVLQCLPGQTNLAVTNLTASESYFVLGRTNDTDGGGLSDAFEQLVTHTDPDDPADDLLTPLVNVSTVDSVAAEQYSTNTATFRLTRLGGYLANALTVSATLAGTALPGVDYALTGAGVNGTNVTVVFGSGQTAVDLTLTATNDLMAEGTETALLTLATNAAWTVNPAHAQATAWIVEDYTRVFTTTADFSLGVRMGLDAANGQLQFQTNLPAQFPFLNVACSKRGTVARIHTTTGLVLGEYRTAPEDAANPNPSYPDPSRTTVDQYGNVWVANRNDDRALHATTNGSIMRIGLIIGGTRHVKSNGLYVPNPSGHYVSLSNATYNTCIDRDGDTFICTSAGLADILPWSNARGGLSDVDSEGGVSTAEDEAILEYTRVACTGTRTIAVDRFNDVWVGGSAGGRIHQKVNGLTGAVVPNSAFAADAGGYGGVIDSRGALWSSPGRYSQQGTLRLLPPAQLPPTTNDWQELFTQDASADPQLYGIAVDPVNPHVWQSAYGLGNVFRWHLDGYAITNANGLQTFDGGSSKAQGLTVDANGHVWVGHGYDNGSQTVGHLDANGAWVGNVGLRLSGLLGEYFANTNLSGVPAFRRADGPVDFDWSTNAPAPGVPADHFSVKWLGQVRGEAEGEHTFFVSADAGAGFRLILGGNILLENWDSPSANAVELSAAFGLSPDAFVNLALDYKEGTGQAQVRLAWIIPGTTNKVPIPRSHLQGTTQGKEATGLSVDAACKLWAGCYGSHNVMRIDPNGGEMVVTNGVTNFVGAVDLEVDLGNGTGHPAPYNVEAQPYNYSDMTGFNNRVVNPGGQPLKGYWAVVQDCGLAGEWWRAVTWTDNLPLSGCEVEVQVRAGDDRQVLVNQAFTPVSNGVPVVGVKGRFIEVRVALSRASATNNPVLYDLTLHGQSSGFGGELFLEPAAAYETWDTWFWVELEAPEPVTYQWSVMYPWTNQFEMMAGETNWYLYWPDADRWEDSTRVSLEVSNGAGETLALGPAKLSVYPLPITIPGSLTNSLGDASRYPAIIDVRGEPSNGLTAVWVTLGDLEHDYPSDMDILLVSPSGATVMLMSSAGSYVTTTNATLVFQPNWLAPNAAPYQSAIPSGQESHYRGSNHGGLTSLPGAPNPSSPSGEYWTDLDRLTLTDPDPNGVWRLYIYDHKQGDRGELHDSWRLDFSY